MSKLQRLRDNIAAIREVLMGGDNNERIGKYTGFGGLGFILNPLNKAAWTKSDLSYFDDTVRLHDMLHEASSSDDEYKRVVQSMKSSVLTAYYTPRNVVEMLMLEIFGARADGYTEGFVPRQMLDPAAGNGIFANMCMYVDTCYTGNVRITCFEKDLLTGMMLNAKKSSNMFVYVDGFENIPSDELGKYDLVATNVPFGDIAVFDPEYSNSKSQVRRDAAKMIHRYYVLKGLDCLRDGGIEAYIITSNYLNRDSEQLAEALKQARLIGAYRLANNLFKENGTEVGTDLLVLQKDSQKQGLTADECYLLTQYEDGGCPTNMYFVMKPDHVIATSTERGTDAYGKPDFVYYHEDGVMGIATGMGKMLQADLAANLEMSLLRTPNTTKSVKPQEERTQCVVPRRERLLSAVHQCYTMLYDYEAKMLQENTVWRTRLNQLYNTFVKEFGPINYAPNRGAAGEVNKELLSLEYRDENGQWATADIFRKPVAFSTEDVRKSGTPQEALAQSLNEYGRPNMEYMQTMTGMSEDELLTALEGEVYLNPLNGDYEIKAKFVSGNVIEKLERCKEKYPNVARYIESEKVGGNLPVLTVPEEMRVLQSMRALQDAIPTAIPFEDLDFNLGERWIAADIYGKFGSEFFSIPDGGEGYGGGKVTVTVKYNSLLDQFAVSTSSRNEKIWSQYSISSEATKSLDGMEMFVHALQNTCPKMMRYQRDSNGCCIYNDKGEHLKEEDPEKTQLANAKIEEIRQGWQDWLLKQPKDFKERLTYTYNRRFNCFVKPRYDGSHQTFPGLSRENLAKSIKGFKDLYQSQKDCIWMLIQNGGGICDHEVGGGKTLIMCVAAHEMRRLGICHKPMIIGLKANVDEIAKTYQTAYPNAKILYAGAKDYAGQEREKFFNRMKNNEWDCVIMSHDQFGRIPQSQEIELEVLQEDMEKLEQSLDALHSESSWSISSQMRKGLERRKRNLEAKRLSLLNDMRKRKDDVVDFQMMAVDHILVDESHQFKNLGFSTRHDRVAGLGNSEGSKRAFNLLMAIRTIQKRTGRDLGATFLSGTTVTNSLTELYSLFNYLRPQALRKQGISCFDAWAAIFTKKTSEYEFSITNQIVMKERFRYFIKVPELAMFYNEITDFRTAEDVGIDRPAKHCMLLNIKPTPDQEDFIKTLMEFAQTGDFKLIGKEFVTDKQQKAKMLYATDMARKMSLDMRLIDSGYGDHPQSKASRCAQLVKRYYDLYDSVKGTQMIFSDLSTWQGANKGWNIYEEIKRKLVEEYGIPASEVRFIQECRCESKKQALIKDVNEGKVRVLFGSTSMLGTGVNAQQRVVAVHHLDTPWRPSDLEQRNGRAIRKGNEVAKLYADNKVDIIIYAVERSLDSYKFNLLHCKQTFIQQLKRGQLSIRTLDEGTMDENTGMNFSEYMAVLSGNTDLLERAKLEKRIAGLEAERKSYLREQAAYKERQSACRNENEILKANLEAATEDMKRFQEVVRYGAQGKTENNIIIDGFKVDRDIVVGSDEWLTEVGKELFAIADTTMTEGKHVTIGSICGFPLKVKTVSHTGDTFDNRFYVSGKRLLYSYNDGKLNRTSARLSAEFPLKALQRIPEIIDGWKQRVEENNSRIAQLSTISGQAWSKEEELRKVKSDLAQLDRKISNELRKDEPAKKAA